MSDLPLQTGLEVRIPPMRYHSSTNRLTVFESEIDPTCSHNILPPITQCQAQAKAQDQATVPDQDMGQVLVPGHLLQGNCNISRLRKAQRDTYLAMGLVYGLG